MAPALTATPDPLRGLVNLTVTGAAGAITVKAYTPLSPMGTGSYSVRGSFANARVVPDYDAPLNTDITYIATDTVGQSAQIVVRLTSAVAWLTAQNSPAGGMTVTVLADRDQRYAGFSVAHKVLNTNAPLVTIEPMAFRSGTYELLCRTVDEFLQLRSVLLPGGVMLLRSPCQTEFLDTTFIVTDSGWSPELSWNAAPPRQRRVSIAYQSVSPDTSPPQDIAWTWADVPATFATWADVPIGVATWADLVTYIPAP